MPATCAYSGTETPQGGDMGIRDISAFNTAVDTAARSVSVKG